MDGKAGGSVRVGVKSSGGGGDDGGASANSLTMVLPISVSTTSSTSVSNGFVSSGKSSMGAMSKLWTLTLRPRSRAACHKVGFANTILLTYKKIIYTEMNIFLFFKGYYHLTTFLLLSIFVQEFWR